MKKIMQEIEIRYSEYVRGDAETKVCSINYRQGGKLFSLSGITLNKDEDYIALDDILNECNEMVELNVRLTDFTNERVPELQKLVSEHNSRIRDRT